MILQINHTILHGKYVIERFLGKGGFGEVYQARNTRLNSVVAVKVIAPGHGSSAPDFERGRLRFETEAQVGAQISHENLIKVYDLEQEGDTWFLISEFAAGGSLNDRLARGALPVGEALAIGVQMCRGAAALHRSGYVHRDIKPSNILFDDLGRAKLADLGLVQTGATIEREVGMAGYHPGTLQYMSPEQEVSRGYLRPASDVYSVGCVLFEMLTGKVYKSLPAGARISSMNPQVSPQLEAIIAKALAAGVEQRYTDGDAFVKAIVEWVRLQPKASPGQPARAQPVKQAPPASAVQPELPSPAAKTSTAKPAAPPARPQTNLTAPAVKEGTAPARPAAGQPVQNKKPGLRPATTKNKSMIPVFVILGGLVVLICVAYFSLKPQATHAPEPTSTIQVAELTSTSPGPTEAPVVTEKIPTGAVLTGVPTETVQGQVAVPQFSGPPIKIGLIAPLTGQYPAFGQSVKEGYEIAIAEWNANGGVLGRQIEGILADGQCAGDPAVNAANKLIDQDGVKFLLGEVCSNASIQVSRIANSRDIVQISPTSTHVLLTVDEAVNILPFIFRACFIDDFPGPVMAKFALGHGITKAFILYDQGIDYVRDLAETFEKSFVEAGGVISGKQTYTSTDTDFSTILTLVATSDAEMIFLPDYYPIANLVGKQAKDLGITIPIMGGDQWDSPDLDTTALDGGFFANHYDPGDTRPIVVDWLKRYGERYQNADGSPKVPDALAALAYDAANLLFTAIEQAASDDPELVRQALSEITFEGVTGQITFDDHNNPIKNAAVIGVMNGQKVFVESVPP